MAAIRRSGAVLLFLACFCAIRLPVVTRAVTADEARWLLRSGNFYQALASGDLAATYQHEHPGVTVTWAGALGYLWRFPDYARLAGEQLPGPSSLENLFADQGRSPLLVLAAGRILVVLALGLILALAGWYAGRLLGWPAAVLGLGLIALDPFSLALTYLLQPDGLSSSMMLLALLAFLAYSLDGGRRLDLLISGAAGGLAVLSKSPAGFLLPFLALASLSWMAVPAAGKPAATRWRRGLKTMLAWAGIAGLTFVILWPAMWVDPLGSLQKMISGTLVYAVDGNQNAIFFNGAIYPGGHSTWYFYPVVLAWRATPVMLGGLILAAGRGLIGRRVARGARLSAGCLLVYAGFYILALSLASQQYDRYLLPAWLALLLLAGWGWAGLLAWLEPQLAARSGQFVRTAALLCLSGLILASQAVLAWQVYPYYYSFTNPLLGDLGRASRVLVVGWGEGLDQAGEYLDGLPNAAGLRVMSWYADGCFSYFFRGRTVGMDANTSLEEVQKMDYVVVYYQQYQRQAPSRQVLDYLDGLSPVKEIRVNGLDLVRIFRIRGGP